MATRMTLTKIRALLKDRMDQTTEMGNGEVYYPASWVYGDSVGDASTSSHHETPLEIATAQVVRDLHLPEEFYTAETTQRGVSLDLYKACREHQHDMEERERQAAMDDDD